MLKACLRHDNRPVRYFWPNGLSSRLACDTGPASAKTGRLLTLARGIAAVRDGAERRLWVNEPAEVMPLVDEVNDLLEDKVKTIQSAKARAADLAHGLKTPLTVLATDAQLLRAKGEKEIADEIDELATVMRRHVDRELVRARLQSVPRSAIVPVLIRPINEGIVMVLTRTLKGKLLTWTIDIPGHAAFAVGADDLAELLGVLCENAAKWAAREVRISALSEKPLRIAVEDDGPGGPEDRLEQLGHRGLRLDQRVEGFGHDL